MENRTKRLIVLLGLLIGIFVTALPALSVYYDVYGTNARLIGDLVVERNATITGTMTQTGTLDVNSNTYSKLTRISGVTTYTMSATDGNVLVISTTDQASFLLTLPTITSTMNGYVLTVKCESGATDIDVTPTAGVDAIEATTGTISGTSAYDIDAAGEKRVWAAVYRSGASSYWADLYDGAS